MVSLQPHGQWPTHRSYSINQVLCKTTCMYPCPYLATLLRTHLLLRQCISSSQAVLATLRVHHGSSTNNHRTMLFPTIGTRCLVECKYNQAKDQASLYARRQ